MAVELPEPTSTSGAYQSGAFVFDMFMTTDSVMTQCLRLALAAAGNSLAVLVTGETGTGKNLIAQAIHNESARQAQQCVVVNCSALSESLLESELFGYEKGAFTGADSRRKGRFELADGGTLVLDEIGDMSPAAQTKILHAVEYKQFHRVGGQETVSTDVRVIALTNRPLDQLVAEGKFRQDLLYRLKEIHIEIPPLRERPEDVPALCQRFLSECRVKLGKELDGFTAAAMTAIRAAAWPGNCRELKAAIRRAALLAEGQIIDTDDLGPQLAAAGESIARAGTAAAPGELSLKAAERDQLIRALDKARGQKKRTCEILGISRPTLNRKLDLHNINADDYHP
jgi:two-component system, NtrC family, response regulator AtoC